MKIFLALILFCFAVFANAVPEISLVSRNNEHLIFVKSALEYPQISYESKGNDIVIIIKSPTVEENRGASFVRKYDNSFIISAMAAQINKGDIKILMKDCKFTTANIQVKQKENVIYFYLSAKPSAQTNEIRRNANGFPLDLIVSGDIVNLRTEPFTNAKVAEKITQGAKLIAADKNGEWYSVKTKTGLSAWIHESVVSVISREVENLEEKQNSENNLPEEQPPLAPGQEYIVSAEGGVKSAAKPLSMVIDSANLKKEVKDTVALPAAVKLIGYTKKGRDPFLPLDKSAFIREGLPNIDNITLVGILYDSEDAIALFEENKDNIITAFSMKAGDPVVSGKLLRIEVNKVVFLLREATFSYTVDKELNNN